jgi:hypothetical protein
MVCSSAWNVEEAKIADWREVLGYLQHLQSGSPHRPVARLRQSTSNRGLATLVRRMGGQIQFMLNNGATQWPVTTTIR